VGVAVGVGIGVGVGVTVGTGVGVGVGVGPQPPRQGVPLGVGVGVGVGVAVGTGVGVGDAPPVIVRMPLPVADWPSGLVIVTFCGPLMAPFVFRFSDTCVGFVYVTELTVM
jgi:hypothetical protein